MPVLGPEHPPENVSELFIPASRCLNQSDDNDHLLRAINNQKAMLLLPAIVVSVLLMLLGLLGNPLAMYIYGWRWQASSTKVFLFSLAVIDLVNCLITIPTEIHIMRNFYTFHSDGLCKVSRFTTYVMNNATSVIFVAIAIDRYIRICHPYKSALSARNAKVACGIGLLLGLGVSWPALFLYGKIEVMIPINFSLRVHGSMCLVYSDKEKYSLAFFLYLCTACSVCLLVLVVLYTLIGRAILKRKKVLRRRKETTAANLENFGGAKDGNAQAEPSSPPLPTRIEHLTPEEESLPGCNGHNISFRCKKLRPPRATLMLFLITVVYIASFLPFLIISIIRQHRGPTFYLGLTPKEEVAVSIFIRSYLVNNCTNPIMYGLCNSQFRDECRRLYAKLFRRSASFRFSSSQNSQYVTPKLERKVNLPKL